jgi:outer membrane receptor protein involved in Fe transport
VTLRSTPALITRQRQNLGRTRSQGLEVEGDFRLAPRLSSSLGYTFVDATVKDFPSDPTLVGKYVPQVPRHQATLQLRYDDPRRLDVAVQMRASSLQYEDDQNRMALAGFFTLDARVAHRFGQVEAFAAAENLTGERYAVGATPILTQGPPVLLRAGVRFDWR